MYRRDFFTGILSVGGFIATGCSLFEPGSTLSQYKPLLRFAVGFGTLRFLDWHPTWVKNLIAFAEQAEAATAGKMIDLTQLEAVLREHLAKLNMPPDERVIIDAFVWAVMYEVGIFLQKYTQDPKEWQLAASEIFGWIKETAKLRLPK